MSATNAPGRGTTPRPGRAGGSTTGLVFKVILLGLLDALVIYALPIMWDHKEWPYVIATIVGAAALNVIYIGRRHFIPGKYLAPGTAFLLIFSVLPVGYTVYNSFTNYGTGHNLSKALAITTLEQNSFEQSDKSARYDLQVLAKGTDVVTGELAFLLKDQADGKRYLGTKAALTAVADDQIKPSGLTRETIDGYTALNLKQVQDRIAEVKALTIPGPNGPIQNDSLTEAYVKLQRLKYDVASDTMRDTIDNIVYHDKDGVFVSDTGKELAIGWRSNVGFSNYTRIFTEKSVRGPFFRVMIWTFVFALMSVFTTFALGLLLALVFNHDRMKGRRLYRSMMIIPYALPSFMTALVWRGMFNQTYGVINRWFGVNIAWLDGQWWPYITILIVNLWLGFPYMFLVTTGALQGIPGDLKEAAFVDGATGLHTFRKITFPLLLISVSPLLISSFAFNFNNFNLIYLLTQGNPPIPGSDAGRTDILISYTYKLAFASGKGKEYGFASAVSVIIFMMVAVISGISFRYTKTFEEVK